jgi:phospholipase C
MPNSDPIRHVVHLMMENRSFDQMLGGLEDEIPEIDGAIPPSGLVRTNADAAGNLFEQEPGAAWTMKPGPKHEHEHVMRQLEGGNAGFASDYADAHPDTTLAQRQQVMSFYGAGTLWALHGLARAFTVCDQWFSSVPGPTWTNRLFAMSGTSQGRVQMPSVSPFDLNLHRYDQTCLFDRLTEANVSWKIYFHDFPLSLLLENVRSRASELAGVRKFFDATKGDESAFPAFTFIEPGYFVGAQNDDHPPHDVRRGQKLIADVYNALRANKPLWESTLLVVTYDEHGGFYDHVAPVGATPPDDHHEEYTFDRYGARVPAVLISPWVPRHVSHDMYDHTSVLRYLSDKWQLGPLGQRVANAKSFKQLIGSTLRDDTPTTLAPPVLHAAAVAVPAPAPVEGLDGSQRAIVAFSEYLESQTHGAPADKAARRAMLTVGPTQQADAAEARALAFLRERGADV